MLRALVASVLGVFVVLAAASFVLSGAEGIFSGSHDGSQTHVISLGDVTLNVTIADTPEARTQGLSGQSGLVEGTGMLFVFPEDGLYAFWMKDMRFSIDILWISHEGEVVHAERDVAPETYPEAFQPTLPVRYVLEVPAGFSQQHNISVGSKANFSAL